MLGAALIAARWKATTAVEPQQTGDRSGARSRAHDLPALKIAEAEVAGDQDVGERLATEGGTHHVKGNMVCGSAAAQFFL